MPEDVWKINMSHEVEGTRAEFNWQRHAIFDHTIALLLYELVLAHPLAMVMLVKGKQVWRVRSAMRHDDDKSGAALFRRGTIPCLCFAGCAAAAQHAGDAEACLP